MKPDLEINKGFKLHYASERERPEHWFRVSQIHNCICAGQLGQSFLHLSLRLRMLPLHLGGALAFVSARRKNRECDKNPCIVTNLAPFIFKNISQSFFFLTDKTDPESPWNGMSILLQDLYLDHLHGTIEVSPEGRARWEIKCSKSADLKSLNFFFLHQNEKLQRNTISCKERLTAAIPVLGRLEQEERLEFKAILYYIVSACSWPPIHFSGCTPATLCPQQPPTR